MARQKLDLRTVLLLSLGMACFGSALPVSGLVGRTLPVWFASEARLVVALLALAPAVIWADKERGPIATLREAAASDRWLLAGMGVIGTFAFSALMVLGMQRAPGAVAAVIMGTTPAVTAVGAFVFLRERLGRWRLAAVALAVIGVIVVNLGTTDSGDKADAVLLGSVLIFAAVVCEAGYSLMGKQLTVSLSPLEMTMTATVIAVIASAPAALLDVGQVEWADVGLSDWVALGWWGAGSMALGSILWFHGLARVEGAAAAPFMALMPLAALLLSYPLLGETPRPVHAVGMLLILAGIGLVTRADREP